MLRVSLLRCHVGLHGSSVRYSFVRERRIAKEHRSRSRYHLSVATPVGLSVYPTCSSTTYTTKVRFRSCKLIPRLRLFLLIKIFSIMEYTPVRSDSLFAIRGFRRPGKFDLNPIGSGLFMFVVADSILPNARATFPGSTEVTVFTFTLIVMTYHAVIRETYHSTNDANRHQLHLLYRVYVCSLRAISVHMNVVTTFRWSRWRLVGMTLILVSCSSKGFQFYLRCSMVLALLHVVKMQSKRQGSAAVSSCAPPAETAYSDVELAGTNLKNPSTCGKPHPKCNKYLPRRTTSIRL
jgi:hypothetical protein